MGFKHQKQNPPNPPNKTHPFHVCLASKPYGNALQGRVAPDAWRTHSANPPNTMIHLFLARLHPLNHMRWLQCNTRRNVLVSHHFSFFTSINFSSPCLLPYPAHPATPRSVIIIDDTPVRSPPPLLTRFLLWISLPLQPRTQPPPPPQCQAPLSLTMGP
ncbi:hypothetical protein O181_080029 [Austropuccinia psidii MF-1]|uniref:Uncharacterized protein n=1 Tax=Austropuccinia psidii MF-1 TaxID=1389203 RepID=A0A9Q3FJL7_9BASI|nr:hypothetical protein [Austropuccinia psidii MF-1]